MLDILKNRTYRHLFLAQIVALMGTGLATVALGLLAYDLSGSNASMVLGTVFAIKMVAYVAVAPIAAALVERLPRRSVLVGLDLARAFVALCLPFVSETWQIYALVIILQAASAAFTPIFQATIPDVLTKEAEYTRALSLSRLAYDLETLLSPALAAALLMVVSYDLLFLGTTGGFLASSLLVLSVIIPTAKPAVRRGFFDRTTRGIRIYLATPRLRGLLAFSMAVSSAGAMVLVNTVVLVKDRLDLGDSAVAVAMGAFGAGSMLAALVLPRLLDKVPDRPLMSLGACSMIFGLIALGLWDGVFGLTLSALMAAWAFVGVGYSAILTPSGRLLRRSSQPEDRPAIFAAQFALSHACWLVTYPLAGALMTFADELVALAVLSVLTIGTVAFARLQWPADDPLEVEHDHPDLPHNHPHVRDRNHHAHPFTIDDLHPVWPNKG